MLLTFEGTRSLKDLTVVPDTTVSSEKSVLSCLHLRLRSPASIPIGSYQQVSKLSEKFVTHMHTPTLVCKRTVTHVCTHTNSIHHVKAMDLCVFCSSVLHGVGFRPNSASQLRSAAWRIRRDCEGSGRKRWLFETSLLSKERQGGEFFLHHLLHQFALVFRHTKANKKTSE